MKGENESLKRDLVEARNKKPEVIVKKEAGFVPRLVVVFNIGKSNISKREYMNIEAMAKGIKATDKVFTITGYADKGTGSAEYNMKLRKKLDSFHVWLLYSISERATSARENT